MEHPAGPETNGCRRRGVTLVEVIIVVAIISVLLMLMLPAVQAARESARQAACKNNLHQLATATQLHVAAHKYFPTGGWSPVWIGDPNRGFGSSQPGGWGFSLLPYVEENALHDAGLGVPETERRLRGAEMFATAIPIFSCPSRRPARAWSFIRHGSLINIDEPLAAGRSDYAANIGNLIPSDQRGPSSLSEGDTWVEGSNSKTQWVATQHNGVIYQRSLVKPAFITDGLSKTYLYGEKFMDPARYESGDSNGDDQSLYVGFDRDNCRSGNPLHPPLRDKNVPLIWYAEGDSEAVTDWNFGSAHPNGVHMLLCDGAVMLVAYDVTPGIHSAFSGRNDGAAAGDQ